MQVRIVDFPELPVHDTTWSLNAGPDGCAYVGVCCEHLGGVAAVVVRYRTDGAREALLDMGEASGQPADNGRATQCKVHDSLIVDGEGVMYAATHLSGPPRGHLVYNPWGNWGDPHVSFAGATLACYDTTQDRLIGTELLYPQEGCRCLALDSHRRRLYSCSYPLNHFHVWDLDSRQDTDYGRIGAVNPIVTWVDPDGNGYTCDDRGRVLRFDAEARRLEELDRFVPHPPFQQGWHNVSYDVVACQNPRQVVGVSWNAFPHLWLYDMGEGYQGRMTDLGPVHEGLTGHEPNEINRSHVAGLTFGPEGKLYLCPMVQEGPPGRGASHLFRWDLQTGEHEDLGPLYDPELDQSVWYVSRAVWLSRQDMIGAVVGRSPTGIVHVHFDEGELSVRDDPQYPRLRLWG